MHYGKLLSEAQKIQNSKGALSEDIVIIESKELAYILAVDSVKTGTDWEDVKGALRSGWLEINRVPPNPPTE